MNNRHGAPDRDWEIAVHYFLGSLVIDSLLWAYAIFWVK